MYRTRKLHLNFAAAVVTATLALPSACLAGIDGLTECQVALGLRTGASLSVLQVDLDYSAAQGAFRSGGGAVECRPVAGGASVTVTDLCRGEYASCQWGESRQLRLAIVSVANALSSGGLVECVFFTAQAPESGSFVVSVLDASAGGLTDALSSKSDDVAVYVSGVRCD